MNILPVVLAGASILTKDNRNTEVDVNSATRALDETPVGILQYPSHLRNDNFYTIFRAYERTADFQRGRLAVSGKKNNPLGTVLLPLPPNLSTAYGVIYGEESIGAIASGISAATSAFETTLSPDESNYGEAFEAAAGSIVDSLTDGQGLSKDGAQALLKNVGIGLARELTPNSVFTGLNLAKNPYQAIVFQNPKFRTHSFSYNLFARDRQETEAIKDIIKLFKEYMLPEFPENTGLFFKYPKVFDIEYHVGGPKNEYVHRISTSALTDFNVSYHGEGTPSYFNDPEEPRPTSVKISMTFQELNIMTAEMARQGY